MKNAVETNQFSFSYGRRLLLTDVTLTVRTGHFYALLGRNGIGKTTLLKVLTGLLEPRSGSATVLGQDTRKLSVHDWTTVGYVSESQKIYDWLTGEELIAFTCGLYPNWDQTFCDRLLRQMKLPLQQKVRRYSKGERMKLILLLAMSFRPKLLLLDEPFSGLDVLSKEQLITCLLDATQQEEWAVLFTSHDLAEVERLADDIGIVEAGRLNISESIESLQQRFRRVQVFGNGIEPPTDSSAWQLHRSDSGFEFVETQMSDMRQKELIDRYDDRMEFQPMALREIVLAFLIQNEPEERR